jgi:hypothetical protein
MNECFNTECKYNNKYYVMDCEKSLSEIENCKDYKPEVKSCDKKDCVHFNSCGIKEIIGDCKYHQEVKMDKKGYTCGENQELYKKYGVEGSNHIPETEQLCDVIRKLEIDNSIDKIQVSEEQFKKMWACGVKISEWNPEEYAEALKEARSYGFLKLSKLDEAREFYQTSDYISQTHDQILGKLVQLYESAIEEIKAGCI